MIERGIVRVVMLMLLGAFLLGAYLLENIGIQYVSEGGSLLLKIHMYSYLGIVLFTLLAVRIGLFRLLQGLGELKTLWWFGMMALLAVIFYGFMRFGTSGLAYLIDTLFIPLLIVPIVCLLSVTSKERLLTLVAYLLFINSCLAIFEFVLGQHMVMVEFASFSHFRSTAFLAHPLNNALITASLAPLLMSCTRIPVVLYLSVVTLALFAFGGRAALGIFLIGNVLIVLPKLVGFFNGVLSFDRKKITYFQVLFFFSFISLAFVLLLTPIGDRIFNKLYLDGSAEARLDVYVLLEQLSAYEWFFGAGYDLLSNIAFYIGINTVENYLIGWVLNFGLLGGVGLLIAAYCVPFALIKGQPLSSKIVLMNFFLISVTNNALTVKTSSLLLLFVVLLCSYRPKYIAMVQS